MIKAIILDIDGVIVGGKLGMNAPEPHPAVSSALQKLRKTGIPVVLCTAKPHFAIVETIRRPQLDNPHVTNGGAVVIDPLTDSIVSKYVINSKLAASLVEVLLKNGTYTEVYTTDAYFIEEGTRSSITKDHTLVLNTAPQEVPSLVAFVEEAEIVKIMPIAKDTKDAERVEVLLEPFRKQITVQWGVHPAVGPLQFGTVTEKGISKEQGARDALQSLGISFENVLGVGDSKSDWEFMKLCGSVAATGNAVEELKGLVRSRGEHGYIGPHVDDNGILDILDHFLTKEESR